MNIPKEIIEQLTEKDIAEVMAYNIYLQSFVERATLKFAKGRIEHRDEDINKLDLEKEIENELFDITAYNFLRGSRKN